MVNNIVSYKKRKVDFNKPVWVYRNLNSKGVNYSIKQNGLVVAHASELVLNDVEFRVSEAGRKRVLRDKKRNVHAFAIGKIFKSEINLPILNIVKYNPKKNKEFMCENLGSSHPTPIKNAQYVIFNKYGCLSSLR